MDSSPDRSAVELSPNAITVLEKRYLLKDETGAPVEQSEDLFWRVATTIAAPDATYGASAGAVDALAEAFYEVMAKRLFMPNSPTNNALVSGGVFGITRNPMYLAMTLFCLGGAFWFGRPVMLLAPLLMFAVANWVFVPFEEAKMRRQFGETFDAYCKRVRRWI